MKIRCPHCRNPIELLKGQTDDQVECRSCGSHLNLLNVATLSHQSEVKAIAHFQLVQHLGVGAFGSVWKARDTKLDRQVAIKIPRASHLSESDRESFLREARAAAQLDHPNIVSVYEADEAADGTIYIVSKFIEGADLSEWAEGQALPPDEAAGLVAKIAKAVQHAHEKGVVHRDLKPSNIMMDLDGNPHVMDFGLAKRDGGEITMTVEGQVLGSPAYMPPEQARGEGHDADARSDVYSLGVILFELLTGVLPFRGTQRMLLTKVLRDEPPSPRSLSNAVPKDLETICLRCMEKTPGNRPQTAEYLAKELGRYLAGDPIELRPVSTAEKAWKWCKRNPLTVRWATALLLLLVVGVTVLVVIRRQARYALMKVAVANLAKVRGNLVPYMLDDLEEDFPNEWVATELKQAFVNGAGDEKLSLAYGLARFADPPVEFLVSTVRGAPDSECDNIVSSLSGAKGVGGRIAKLAAQADEESDWSWKGRLAVVGIHFAELGIAKDVHDNRTDPTQQTVFIHEVFPTWHGDLNGLAVQSQEIESGPLRAGLALAIGNLPEDELGDAKAAWQSRLSRWYLESPDSGTHSAAGWALRQWKIDLPETPADKEEPNERNWKVTPHGFTMVRIPAGMFERTDGKTKQQLTLTRDLWLSDVEVTVGLFQQFMNDNRYSGLKPEKWEGVVKIESISPTKDHPAQQVSWEDAVLFCNWLSWKEGRKSCYKVTQSKAGFAIELLPTGTGYRLPTVAEWEFACRAGATTTFGFGSDAERLKHYAVFSAVKAQPVASKMCNRCGLFDVHGNVQEWCHAPLEVRGGGWFGSAWSCRLGFGFMHNPGYRSGDLGFRVAQVPLPARQAIGAASDRR